MHEAMAFRTAYLVTQNEADAADAVQEAVYRAYAALGRFRRGAPFRPWLLRIVVNEAKDRRSATRRFGTLTLRATAEYPTRESPKSPEALAVAREIRTELIAALNRLRERDRFLIACRYFLELSEEEMMAVLECPRGTVKSRLSRALERLRLELRTEG